jgi:arylsulfatase A-like enzyme
MDLIQEDNPERGPDIMFTFRWNSAPNAAGVPGTDYINSRTNGPLSGESSGHGSISPYTIRNTMVMWGPDFKSGTVVRTPSSNVDVMPTILAIKNLPLTSEIDGRVLSEAFRDVGDEEQIITETSTITAESGNYKIAIQLSRVGSSVYVDKSWRIH